MCTTLIHSALKSGNVQFNSIYWNNLSDTVQMHTECMTRQMFLLRQFRPTDPAFCVQTWAHDESVKNRTLLELFFFLLLVINRSIEYVWQSNSPGQEIYSVPPIKKREALNVQC